MGDNYIEIFNKIEHMLRDKKYSEVLEMIEENINSPFTSSNNLEKFIEFKKRTLLEYEENILMENININYLIRYVKMNKNINLSDLEIFLNKNKEEVDWNFLNEVFLSKSIDNSEKISIIQLLNSFDISFDFIIFNNRTNENIKINPSTFKEMKDIEYYKNVEKEINNILFKNPTAFSLSRDILKKIYIYYFTTIPNIKIDVLSLSIKNFVLGIKIDDEKANKLLNTIITS